MSKWQENAIKKKSAEKKINKQRAVKYRSPANMMYDTECTTGWDEIVHDISPDDGRDWDWKEYVFCSNGCECHGCMAGD